MKNGHMKKGNAVSRAREAALAAMKKQQGVKTIKQKPASRTELRRELVDACALFQAIRGLMSNMSNSIGFHIAYDRATNVLHRAELDLREAMQAYLGERIETSAAKMSWDEKSRLTRRIVGFLKSRGTNRSESELVEALMAEDGPS
jgi:hypothetical protein